MIGYCIIIFLFQAEDGIRELVRSRGLGDVYKRQTLNGGGLEFLPGLTAVLCLDHRGGVADGITTISRNGNVKEGLNDG